MRLGQLRHRVTIQNPTKTATTGGNYDFTWPASTASGIKAWARIEPLSSSERFYAAGEQGTVTHKVSMHYTTAVKAESRLVYENRYLYVQGPPYNPDGRKIELQMMCVERDD